MKFFRIKRRAQSGLTLVEMMVATTLLVVIMLGLTMMFNQTQRAFRSGLKQVDVFEGGRAVMDLISRDVEQTAPSETVDNWSFFCGPQASTSLIQRDPANTYDLRTNILDELFVMNHGADWSAIGYRVLDSRDPNNFNNLKVGTLYRFTTNFTKFPGFPASTNSAFHTFNGDFGMTPATMIASNYLSRVIDGVVHFKVKVYDNNGVLIPMYDESNNLTNNIPPLQSRSSSDTSITDWAGLMVSSDVLPGEQLIGFASNALPAMVEIELGILEPQTLEQARSVQNPDVFLQKQAGKVHIFRQQIPIRNAPR
jgi:hypothetical protein